MGNNKYTDEFRRMAANIVVLALEPARRRGYVAEGPSPAATATASTPRGCRRRGPGKGREARLRRTGSCHGNAAAGPLFATLRSEMYCRRPSPRARGEARRDRLHRVLYNRRRPHSTIGYRVPADVMDESFGRFEGALSEPREVLRAA